MDLVTRGRGSSYWNWIQGPATPFTRPAANNKASPRLNPATGGGRRMRHPFLEPIVYPRNPDRILNFGYDRLRRITAAVVKTLTSTAVAKFPQEPEDVPIVEVWQAGELSTLTSLFHEFHTYWREVLPSGRYIGWQPRDLTWKSYFIDLIDVSLGPGEEFVVEELGHRRPLMMRETLRVSFKLIREAKAPAGALTIEGD